MPTLPITKPVASSQVNVRNLIPLDLWIKVEDSRRALRPFDQVVAMRPEDSKFGIEVNGVFLGWLPADRASADLKITPEAFSTLLRPKATPDAAASAILENRTNVELRASRLDREGRPGLSFKLDKAAGRQYGVSGSAGDIYIVRDAFQGDVLGMFVLGSEEPELEIAITDKFRALRAAPPPPKPQSDGNIKVANLTPLDLSLEYWDGETVQTRHLKPHEDVDGQERPPFGKFRVKANGMRMGVLEVDPEAKQLSLDPSFFCSLPQGRSLWDPIAGSGSMSMVNTAQANVLNSTNVSVDIFCRKRKQDATQQVEEQKIVTLPKGESNAIPSWPGAVYVVRHTGSGNVLAMYALQGGSEDLAITGGLRAKTDAAEELELFNATPLQLTVTDGAAEHSVSSLGTIKVKRSALGYGLKHGGIGVGSLMLEPGVKNATIEPGLLRTEPPGRFEVRGEGSWPLSNESDLDIEIYRVSQSGQEVVPSLTTSITTVRDGPSVSRIDGVKGTPGDVCVVREATTKELLDMFVLGMGQDIKIRAEFAKKVATEVEVVNLTPLTLDVQADAGPMQLKPFDGAKLKRSPGGMFRVMHNGFAMRDLRVDRDKRELKIVPSLFRSLRAEPTIDRVTGFKSMTWHAPQQHIIRNETGAHVDVFWVDHSGQEVKKLTLDPDPSVHYPVEGYGDVYVARGTFAGDMLAMFVLGALPSDKHIVITSELSAPMADNSLKLPVIPGGSFNLYGEFGSELQADMIPSVTLLGEKRERPDPRSKQYILISEQPANPRATAKFNNRANVNTRAVTITGVELVWNAGDDSYGLMAYQGQSVLDIETLEMFADRVVIASEIWFPGTNVTIHARELEFRGSGMIKTTPIDYAGVRAEQPVRLHSIENAPKKDGEGIQLYQDGKFELGEWSAEKKAWTGKDGAPLQIAPTPTHWIGGVIKQWIGDATKDAYGKPLDQSRNLKGKDGLDGEPGGNIRLFVGKLKSNEARPKFWTKGADGQQAERGGEGLYKKKRPGQPEKTPDVPYVKMEQIKSHWTGHMKNTGGKNALTDYVWPTRDPGKWANEPARMCLIDPPSTDFPWEGAFAPGSTGEGHVVSLKIVACRNDFYGYTYWFWIPEWKYEEFAVIVTDVRHALTEPFHAKRPIIADVNVTGPVRQRPGDGADAYSGGRPGNGGPGGSIEMNFPVDLRFGRESWFVFDGGAPGPETPLAPGGRKGRPAPAYWFDVVAKLEAGAPAYQMQDVTAKDGEPAQALRAEPGRKGTLRQVEGDWMTAEIVDAVIACARDAYRNGHRDLAMSLLDPYYAALRSSGGGAAELQGRFVVIETMRANLLRNADFYGNPPGWLPRLSLAATLDIFNTVRGISAGLLYFAQTTAEQYGKIEQSTRLAEKATEMVAADMDNNMLQLKKAYSQLDEARIDLETIERDLQSKQNLIGQLKSFADEKAKDKVKEQRIFRGVMKIVGGAAKAVPVGQPYLGLAGDMISGVGDLDFTNPATLPTQISGTLGKVGGLMNTFLENNKDLIVDDRHPTTPDAELPLNEQVRLAKKAIDDHETATKRGQKDDLKAWENDNRGELAKLKSDEAELAKIDSALDQFELEDTERERVKAIVKKKYGDLGEGEVAEALLDQRLLLMEAVKKGKARMQRARGETERQTLETAQKKLEQLQGSADGASEKLERAKSKKAIAADERERKRKQTTNTITRLKNIGDGVSSIGVGVASLMSAPTSSDEDVQNLSKMLLQSEHREQYEKLLKEAQEVSSKQGRAMAKLNQAQQELSNGVAEIATNLSELDALSHQRQSLSPVLDVRVKRHLKGMEARARDTLRWAVYAVVQSWRYEMLDDAPPELYNLDAVVEQIRKLKAASTGNKPGQVPSPTQLSLTDFTDIDDTVFRGVLFDMAVEGVFKKRQKFASDKDNSTPAALSEEQLTTLKTTGNVTFNLLRDFNTGLTVKAVRARIVDLTLDSLDLTLQPGSKVDSMRVVFDHSGQSIVRDPRGRYYYFRQAPEDHPVSWGFSYKPAAVGSTPATATITKDSKDSAEEEEILKQLMPKDSAAASTLSKFKEYYPSLFSDITLSLKTQDLGVIKEISSAKFTVKYRLSKD